MQRNLQTFEVKNMFSCMHYIFPSVLFMDRSNSVVFQGKAAGVLHSVFTLETKTMSSAFIVTLRLCKYKIW